MSEQFKNLRSIQKNYPEEYIAPGNAGCPGCGAVLAVRLAMKVLGSNTWGVMTTGCMAVNYTVPNTGVARSPWIHPLFGNAAALASGLDSALKLRGLEDKINLLVVGGDGATADIGFQARSSAFMRRHRFIYLCYDNAGYQNTGGQRSGTTDFYAQTKSFVEEKFPKNLIAIFREHNVPYLATANIAYPEDFMEKIHKASQINGPSYIQVFTPCVPGWGIKSDLTIKVAQLAVTTGYQILYELENDNICLSKPSHKLVDPEQRVPLIEFLKLQKRFRDLLKREDLLEIMKQDIERHWKKFRRNR
ncbi:MAG: thiamine pyrophosphate-dependent enzyme [Candidatus Hodarchaeales archaeon]